MFLLGLYVMDVYMVMHNCEVEGKIMHGYQTVFDVFF